MKISPIVKLPTIIPGRIIT